MWQYTTETIINSNKGNLDGGVRALIVNKDGSTSGSASGAELSDEATLLIDGVGSFIKKYVKRVTKYAYRAAANEVVEITIPTVTADNAGVWRLTVAVREEGRAGSMVQDAYLHHSKPFHFEVAVAAADDAVEAFVKVIKKTLALSDFKFFSASKDSAKLVLTAADSHIRFLVDGIRVDKVDLATPASKAAGITGWENYVSVLTTAPSVKTKGDCGAGTVEHLIKDLRIPTNASINPFGADQGGKPVPGGKYDQFLIEYETPRAHVAHGVMGSVGEVSRTSHVLFLEQEGAKDIAELVEAFGDLEEVTIPAQGVASKVAAPGSVQ